MPGIPGPPKPLARAFFALARRAIKATRPRDPSNEPDHARLVDSIREDPRDFVASEVLLRVCGEVLHLHRAALELGIAHHDAEGRAAGVGAPEHALSRFPCGHRPPRECRARAGPSRLDSAFGDGRVAERRDQDPHIGERLVGGHREEKPLEAEGEADPERRATELAHHLSLPSSAATAFCDPRSPPSARSSNSVRV